MLNGFAHILPHFGQKIDQITDYRWLHVQMVIDELTDM